MPPQKEGWGMAAAKQTAVADASSEKRKRIMILWNGSQGVMRSLFAMKTHLELINLSTSAVHFFYGCPSYFFMVYGGQ